MNKSKKITKGMVAIVLMLIMSFLVGCTKTTGTSNETKKNQDDKVVESEQTGVQEGKEQEHPEYLNLTGMPIVNKPMKLSIMVNNSAVQPNFENVKMFQAYEEMTGIEVEWINIPAGSTSEKVNLAFASNTLPDAFLKCGSVLNNINQFRFGADGMIIDLNKDGMLEMYAPNFFKFMNDNKTVKNAIEFPNGAIYSFAQGTDSLAHRVAGKTFINQKWLDALEREQPTTMDELYDMLVAFKNEDPNGNGQADEIPLSSPNFNYIFYGLYGSYGLGNRGVHDWYVDADEETGKARLIATTDEYKEFLTFLAKLFKEELLDNDIFTMKSAQYVAKQSEGRVGMFTYTNLATIPDNIGEMFEPIKEPFKGPNGHQLWFPVRSNLHSTGAFVITSKCEYPEVAMRWVDYFYSDEGNLMFNYGLEGETYVKKPDGKYDFVDSIYDSIQGTVTFDAAVAPYVVVGGNNPIIVKDQYFYGKETDPKPSQGAKYMEPYFPETIWPILNFTQEETEELSVYLTDITNYSNKMRAEFITGKTSFDQWDNYIEQLNKMGLPEMLEIYNQVLERLGY